MSYHILIKSFSGEIMRINLHCIICILLLVCSCNKVAYEQPTKDEVFVVLNVCQQGETKAAPVVEQDAISDINILFYDCNGMLSFAKYVEYPSRQVGMEVFMNLDYSVYALANVGNLTEHPSISTEEGLRKLSFSISDKRDVINSDGSMAMSSSIGRIRAIPDAKIEIPLVRLVSRFRLIVDTTGLDESVTKFDIKEVRLRNLNKNVLYFSAGKACSQEDILPVGESYSGSDLNGLFTSGVDFYMLENAQGDLLDGNNQEQSHIPPQEYADLCTYVEIVVDYRSSSHYDENLIYRYYIHDGAQLDNFDILRNTMYVCTTRFIGDGINEDSWRIDVSGMKDLVQNLALIPSEYKFKNLGDSLQIVPRIVPLSAEHTDLSWHSTDSSVAVVNSQGMVHSVSNGKCKVTATTTDGTNIMAECQIEVDTYRVPEQLYISPSVVNMYHLDAVQLEAVILPEDAVNKSVIWRSDNTSIARVFSSGLVKGVSVGTCNIIATTQEGGLTAYATINVMDKDFILDPVPDVLYASYSSPFSLTWRSDPEGFPSFTLQTLSGDQSKVWVSGDSIVLKSWTDGDPKGGVFGRYKLVSSLNNVVHINEFDASYGHIEIDRASIQKAYYLRDRVKLKVSRLEPHDVDYVWSSQDPKIATMTSDGYITFEQVGKVRVMVRSLTGAYDTVTLNVEKPSLEITNKVVNTYQGYGVKVNVRTIPYGRFPLKWEMVRGSYYADVDENGVVTGKIPNGSFTTRLRVSLEGYPSVYDEVDVNVYPAVSLTLNDQENKLLNTSGYSSVVVNTIPKNLSMTVETAPNTSVVWSVKDPQGNLTNDISITSEGVITAKGNANGVYTIEGFDNSLTYSSEPITIAVYKYMEYLIGLEQDGTEELVDGGQDIRIVYSMNSKWDSRVSSFATGSYSALKGARILCYPESAYLSANLVAGTGNSPVVFARNVVHQEGYVSQFDIWDYLVPRSYLYNPMTTEVVSGLKGMEFRFSENKDFYYIKQADGHSFYNEGAFSGFW